MRSFCLASLLLLSIVVHAQNIVGNPSTSQTIAQPDGTQFSVNRFESMVYADQFSGSDMGAKTNAAISALCSRGGGVVEVPAGSYTFSTPIVLNCSNLWLRGQGFATTLSFTGGSGTNAVTLGNGSPSTINHLWVTDLTIDCNSSGGNGVKVQKGTSVGTIIERNTLRGAAAAISWGDTGTTAFDGLIRANDIQTTTSGVGIDFVFGAHSVTVDSNWIRGNFSTSNGSIGVRVQGGSTAIRLVNNNIEGNAGNNVILSNTNGSVNAVYIGHNYFEPVGTNGIDIDVGTVNGTIIDSNYSNANTTPSNYSIRIEPLATNTVIEKNTLLNASVAEITNTGGSIVEIRDNNWASPKLIDNEIGTAAPFGTFSPLGFPFQVKEPHANDAIAYIYNTDPNGYGLAIRNGTNSNYALSIQDATTTESHFRVWGNGDTWIAGNVTILGTLTKSAGSFKIDHPLDPANKYLAHSFVESPDMMNIYNGIAVLNLRGEAMVELPSYFEALNRDFRYQLTSVGKPQPRLYISQQIAGNRFRIAGGKPGGKVSWQVTGIRHDPYASHNRIKVEEDKTTEERGHYYHPELLQPNRTNAGSNLKENPICHTESHL